MTLLQSLERNDEGTGEMELDFPSDHVPAPGSSIIAYGSVSSGPEVDVYAWEPLSKLHVFLIAEGVIPRGLPREWILL